MPSAFQSGISLQYSILFIFFNASILALCENTSDSSNEFDASLLAPCNPVEAHSPEA
jgi:hypothetical protein